jgi:hypothetical protein
LGKSSKSFPQKNHCTGPWSTFFFFLFWPHPNKQLSRHITISALAHDFLVQVTTTWKENWGAIPSKN